MNSMTEQLLAGLAESWEQNAANNRAAQQKQIEEEGNMAGWYEGRADVFESCAKSLREHLAKEAA
jgi:hypothetical protein